MNEKIKAALGDSDLAAMVRWVALIFTIAVSWANLKGDVKQIAHDQAGNAASEDAYHKKVDSFMEGTISRNENMAGWYERVHRAEQEIDELRYQVSVLSARPVYRPQTTRRSGRGALNLPDYPDSRRESSVDEDYDWRSDPRRNPTN